MFDDVRPSRTMFFRPLYKALWYCSDVTIARITSRNFNITFYRYLSLKLVHKESDKITFYSTVLYDYETASIPRLVSRICVD